MSKKIQLTPAQTKAVELRGHTMLVSAAAGSGKTAVLTKRIIELITDSDDPVDVSDILVVTFTKAAATELKDRISSAIYSALKEDPSNKHLSNQLMKLGGAKICTIHSFCSSLIRGNFQLLGLPATLRIADETESSLICNNVMNELIDECYGGIHSENIEDFAEFTESFLQGKTDEGLAFIFSNIYRKLRNYPEGIGLLDTYAKQLNESENVDIFSTTWGKVIVQDIKRTFEHYYGVFTNACKFFSSDELFAKNYLPSFEADLRFCYNIKESLNAPMYEDIKTKLYSREKVKLINISSDKQTDESLYYKDIRTVFSKKVEDILKKYFSFSEQTVRDQITASGLVCKNMYEFLKLFDARFKKEKRDRGLLDYNDLENYTIELLYKKDTGYTELTDFALSLRDKFRYIFIDEYQDVNELQDKIFSGISTSKNRFMVGDIKQSIYGFRGSEPRLFSEYRTKFPEYKDTCPASDGVTLYLSDNFRSNKSVIDFSNSVFDVLFRFNSGSMEYTEGDKLVCSRKYNEGEQDYPVRICFVKEDAELNGVIGEAEFVADEVEKLIKSGTAPSDIALLFRSKTNTVYFEEALKKRNIDSFNRIDKDFFENDAVLLMLCLLNTIDNPTRDIYLAGVMKSPIFSFSMTDLTVIKQKTKKSSLYESVKEYASVTGDDKCVKFLETLNVWRKYAEGCPVDKLIRYIYNQTHIVELLSGRKNSDSDIERHANLLLLYEYARQFENGSFKGLYNFILYLNDVVEKRTTLANARLTSEESEVVNIMTVHNSKGLEFDTVFICDTAHRFNREDEKNNYIFHKELGLTMSLRDKTYLGKFKTLHRCAAEMLLRQEDLEEELRVLYVALTRAKKRLVITSSLKKQNEIIDSIKSEDNDVSQYALLNSNSLIELILWGILKSDYDFYSLEYVSPTLTDETVEVDRTSNELNRDLIEKYKDVFRERLSFEYPYKELTVLPSKMAVSKLYPTVLDEYTAVVEPQTPSMYLKPKFMLPENNKATGADRGTATHVFMQFCDFERVLSYGVQAEIDKLYEMGFIDKNISELVNIEKVSEFFRSDFFKLLRNAKNVWRERRFNINLPAVEFSQDEVTRERLNDENVLVQGVIDIVFVDENDRLILADYKTDYFSKQEIESGEAEETLKTRHSNQLFYYSEACRRMFGREVDSIMIYSFALGREVIIK